MFEICCPYTDGYFKSLYYDISQIWISSEVLISTFTKQKQKNDKNSSFTENYAMILFCF